MSNDVRTVSDYMATFRRRSMLLASTIFVILLAFITVAYVLPPTYYSSGTILIEQQDVPEDLVRSTVTNYAEERIQIVTQRVMTTVRLEEIIERLGLYADEWQGAGSPAELVDRFRADTSLETLRAELSGGRNAMTSTIAFTVGYHNESPQVARQVAAELVDLYLSENARSRAEAATETSAFLSRRAESLDAELKELEQRLAEFKEQHPDSLPQLQTLNRDRMEATTREIESLTRDIRALRDSSNLLETELALISPFAAYESVEGTMAAPQRLDALQREYIALSSRYAPSHPDLIRVRREIELLTGGTIVRDLTAVEEQLYSQRLQLQSAQQQYSATHPEVARIERQIRELEARRTEVLSRSEQDARPTNPLFIQKEGQLTATRNQLAASEGQLGTLIRQRDDYESRLMRSPQVEREFSALEREYDAKLVQFREIQAKRESAQLAETLEMEQRGERFTVIDPPKVPEDPVSPNRIGIMLLGLVLAIGAGLGFATLADSMDQTVRGARDIEELFHAPPLASIMYVENRADIFKRRLRAAIVGGAALAGIATVAVIIRTAG